LQICEPGIESGAFLVQLRNATTQLANLSHQSRVIRQNVLYGIGIAPACRVEVCLIDQVRGYFEGRSHNRDYMKLGADACIFRT
jgi:hypothetical protein